MKITLVQAPFKKYAIVNPPLGLAYLAAVLKSIPYALDVTIIDANAEQLTLEQTVARIIDSSPDLLGMTMTSPLVNASFEIIRKVKSLKDILVVVGGAHPTIMPEEMLGDTAVDIVVRGEGEETVVDLVRYVQKEVSLQEIKGVSFKKNGKVIHTSDRPAINDLDLLPFPAWELFPIEKYFSMAGRKKFCLPVMTSRGCPYDCIFCYKGIFAKGYRVRSPESVIKEIEYLATNFHIEEFVILDDNFTLQEKRALEICQGLRTRTRTIPWRLPNGIAVKATTPQLFSALQEAGCYQIAVGVESGSQDILDSIGKGITIPQIRNAFKLAKQAGLETVAFFMIGNIGENAQTIDKTIDFAIELEPDFAQFTVATPYPGTKMRSIVLQEGRLLSDDWEDYASYNGRAVFEHGELTAALMAKKYKEAYHRFYLRPAYMLKRLKSAFSLHGFINILQGVKVFMQLSGSKK